MRQKSLFLYVLLIFLSLTLLTIGTISIFSIRILSDSIYREVESSLTQQGRIIANQLRAYNQDEETSYQNFTALISQGINSRITLIATDGKVLADSHENYKVMDNHSNRPEVSIALEGSIGSSRRLSSTLSEQLLYIAVPPGESGIIIRLALSIDFIGEKVLTTYKKMIVFSLIILLLTLLFSVITARGFTRTIGSIKDISTHYSKGDFSKKLPENGPREVALLKKSINRMGEQLQHIINKATFQKNELQAMVNSMVEPVILLDNNLLIKEMNPAAEKLTGRTLEVSRKKKISDLIENKRIGHLVEKSLTSTEILEETVRLNQSIEQYVQIHSTPIFDIGGKNRGILLVMNNITRIKQLENMRRDFVSNVSHELKTPITLINGYVETLLDGASEDKSKRDQFLSVIGRHSQRLNSIIDDLLILSNIEDKGNDLVTENVLLNDLLFSAYTSALNMAEKENIKMEVICYDKLLIRVNPILLEQAVFNLINNAVKYSGSGSKVIITGKQVLSNGEKSIEISIEDNGIGIEDDQIDRIFERFYRINKNQKPDTGGTGLGLSIVRHIILAHKGRISVVSNKDRGCKFTISLPISLI
ncbi:MAG: PAS domain-containing protein [Spirochaetaceae bacterium]|nr:PAS domain-containing protein [Spirochaetaceae bacterium]